MLYIQLSERIKILDFCTFRFTKLYKSFCRLYNEITFDKIEEKKSIIIATAKGDEGYFTEQGYSGLFVVLEWCEWDCSQSIEVFSKEFEKTLKRIYYCYL